MKPTVSTVDSTDRFALEYASFGPSVVNVSNDDGGDGGDGGGSCSRRCHL